MTTTRHTITRDETNAATLDATRLGQRVTLNGSTWEVVHRVGGQGFVFSVTLALLEETA